MVTREQLLTDVGFLVERASGAARVTLGKRERDTGVSSNALVRFAYGGPPPSGNEFPWDDSDMAACRLAVRRLPEHRRTPEVLEQLHRVCRGRSAA